MPCLPRVAKSDQSDADFQRSRPSRDASSESKLDFCSVGAAICRTSLARFNLLSRQQFSDVCDSSCVPSHFISTICGGGFTQKQPETLDAWELIHILRPTCRHPMTGIFMLAIPNCDVCSREPLDRGFDRYLTVMGSRLKSNLRHA